MPPPTSKTSRPSGARWRLALRQLKLAIRALPRAIRFDSETRGDIPAARVPTFRPPHGRAPCPPWERRSDLTARERFSGLGGTKLVKYCRVRQAQRNYPPSYTRASFFPRIITTLSISESRTWDLGRNGWRQKSKSSLSHSSLFLQSPLAVCLGMLLNEKLYDSSLALNHIKHSLKDVQEVKGAASTLFFFFS